MALHDERRVASVPQDGKGKRPTQPYTHAADGRSNPIIPVKFWNVFKRLRIPLGITGCGYESGVTRRFEKVGC